MRARPRVTMSAELEGTHRLQPLLQVAVVPLQPVVGVLRRALPYIPTAPARHHLALSIAMRVGRTSVSPIARFKKCSAVLAFLPSEEETSTTCPS
jgi:hypothetical protein